MTYSFFAEDEAAMVQFGRALGQVCESGVVVFLQGDLGMGKTTLCRGVLEVLGHSGSVKSPTYTLVEPYELAHHRVYHFDLYRLGDPEELEYFGVRDYFDGESLCLIEWPDKGKGVLPLYDLEVSIVVEGQGRRLTWVGLTDKGESYKIELEKRLISA